MAEGTIDFLPELETHAEVLLPLGITIVSRETYGSSIRMTISGDGIEAGKTYQLVITDHPMSRAIDLVKSPNQGA